jgi:hypothetical protein
LSIGSAIQNRVITGISQAENKRGAGTLQVPAIGVCVEDRLRADAGGEAGKGRRGLAMALHPP